MDGGQILEKFLSQPLSSADGVFEIFEQLPGAVIGRGENPLERFVYIPGSRKDRVLLVAHGDTVWDKAYGNPCQTQLCLENGVYFGTNPNCGIGADDRAGCAMLWALRESGHSLLVVNGEEKGKHGAKYLRDHYKSLYRQINRHAFMIEMDWAGSCGCLYNQVDNTDRFKNYISNVLGFHDSKQKGGCDLQILCRRVCGVNLSVGWQNCHRPDEKLVIADWEKVYHALSDFLAKPQIRFPIPAPVVFKRFLQRIKMKIGSFLRKYKLLPDNIT